MHLYQTINSSKLFNKHHLKLILMTCAIKHYNAQGGSRLPGGSLSSFPYSKWFREITQMFISVQTAALMRCRLRRTSLNRRQQRGEMCNSFIRRCFLITTKTYSGAVSNLTCSRGLAHTKRTELQPKSRCSPGAKLCPLLRSSCATLE